MIPAALRDTIVMEGVEIEKQLLGMEKFVEPCRPALMPKASSLQEPDLIVM
jgi:hypothetical protein